jgi:hypothetical protein
LQVKIYEGEVKDWSGCGVSSDDGERIRLIQVGWTGGWGNENGWGHADLFVVVDAALLLAVVPVEEGMLEGSVVVLPMRVELAELVG